MVSYLTGRDSKIQEHLDSWSDGIWGKLGSAILVAIYKSAGLSRWGPGRAGADKTMFNPHSCEAGV